MNDKALLYTDVRHNEKVDHLAVLVMIVLMKLNRIIMRIQG